MLEFLVILGSLLVAFGFIAMKLGADSSFYPPIEGVIVESAVIEVTEKVKSSMLQESRDMRQWEKLFQPLVTYEYTYQGTHLTSHSISIASGDARALYGSKEKAESLAKKYPIGKKVSVYRKKSEPELSVIELGTPRVVKTAIFLGFLVLSSSVLLHFIGGAV